MNLPLPSVGTGFVSLTRLQRQDGKGRLTWLPFRDLPFVPERIFWVEDFILLGNHAAMKSDEALFVLSGEVEVTIDRPGCETVVLNLSSATPGMLIPAGWWRTVSRTVGPSRILCLCSGQYDEAEMVRTRDEFKRVAGRVTWLGR